MFKIMMFIFTFYSTVLLFPQLVTIAGGSTYIDVYRKESINSKIAGRLFRGDVFLLVNNDDLYWAEISYVYPIRQLEKEKADYYLQELKSIVSHDTIFIQGYVQKNKILNLRDLKEISKMKVLKNSATLKNDSITFVMKKDFFHPEKHKIERFHGEMAPHNIKSIDGGCPYGFIGKIPKYEIEMISLLINDKKVEIPYGDYSDLYEPNLRYLSLRKDNKGKIFIFMPSNSDGSGGYDAVWIIKECKYIKRYVDGLN